MGDPRVDEETKRYWDELTATLHRRVDAVTACGPPRDALHEVLDLHVAWEFREQQVGSDDPDRIIGIGCRSCGDAPAQWVPLHYRPCLTLTRLEAILLPRPQPCEVGSSWTHRDHPGVIFTYTGRDADRQHSFAVALRPPGSTILELRLPDGPALFGLREDTSRPDRPGV